MYFFPRFWENRQENKVTISIAPTQQSQWIEKQTDMNGNGYTSHANSIYPQNKYKKIFYLSFYQNTIYGISIIKNRFTIPRQRKLAEHKWFYDRFKWRKFCKWRIIFMRYIRSCWQRLHRTTKIRKEKEKSVGRMSEELEMTSN